MRLHLEFEFFFIFLFFAERNLCMKQSLFNAGCLLFLWVLTLIGFHYSVLLESTMDLGP